MWSWGLNGPLFFSSFKQLWVSLNAYPSHLCHILIRTNRWWKVWTVHTVSLRKPRMPVPQQSPSPPSAAFYVPHPHHIANPTLFSSSFLFPPSYFTLSLQHSAPRSVQTAASHPCQPSSSRGWPRQDASHPRALGLLTLVVRLGRRYD